jgi:hypothetical protein
MKTQQEEFSKQLAVNRKAIFLDIEGVIVSHRTIIAHSDLINGVHYSGGNAGWLQFVDTVAMALVFRLAKSFGAYIVLTSTLRYKPNVIEDLITLRPCYVSENEAREMFSLGVTGRTSSMRNDREGEILTFVEQHKLLRYVVIDDRNLDMGNFVNCNSASGITYNNYQDAKEFLVNDDEEINYEAIYL